MLYNENLHEEEQHLIQQIAEQTERGKIDWELTEYNPLSFLNEDKIDKNPAVICQSFSFEAIIGGSRYVKAKLFCPEIAGLFCRIAGLFCHDSRANLSLKPVCFGIAIS